MTKKLLTVLGALSVAACGGSGVPYDGSAGGPDGGYGADGPISLGGATASAGTATTGGSEVGAGGAGEETAGADSGTSGSGGYSYAGTGGSGGYGHAGTHVGGEGGYGYAGTHAGGEGGYDAGGAAQGGEASGGTGAGGGSSSVCSQNVAQCFDAAANCYQYSPWSDCDQIVDVCAAMQAECSE